MSTWVDVVNILSLEHEKARNPTYTTADNGDDCWKYFALYLNERED